MSKVIFRNPINKKEYPITPITIGIPLFGFLSAAAGAGVMAIVDSTRMVQDAECAGIFRRWYDTMPSGVMYDFYTDVGRETFPLKNPMFYIVSQEDEPMVFKAVGCGDNV